MDSVYKINTQTNCMNFSHTEKVIITTETCFKPIIQIIIRDLVQNLTISSKIYLILKIDTK